LCSWRKYGEKTIKGSPHRRFLHIQNSKLLHILLFLYNKTDNFVSQYTQAHLGLEIVVAVIAILAFS
jgi:hypothetical protein